MDRSITPERLAKIKAGLADPMRYWRVSYLDLADLLVEVDRLRDEIADRANVEADLRAQLAEAKAKLPEDARARTENEDTPNEAALLAAEGAVPGDVYRTPVDRLGLLPTSSQRESETIDLIAALRKAVEAAKTRREVPTCSFCDHPRDAVHHSDENVKGWHPFVSKGEETEPP